MNGSEAVILENFLTSKLNCPFPEHNLVCLFSFDLTVAGFSVSYCNLNSGDHVTKLDSIIQFIRKNINFGLIYIFKTIYFLFLIPLLPLY